MAKAPRPGVGARNERADEASKVMRLRIKDETRVLAIGSIPLKERLIVRKATGLPLDAFYSGEDAFGLDTLMILWWLAGRAQGDPFLTLTKVEEDWPETLEAGDFDVEVDDPAEEDADPEA